MKKFVILCIITLMIACSSCSGKKAEEMYETAQFEELQKNFVHARQLYQEILDKYPESEISKKASERLKAIKDKP